MKPKHLMAGGSSSSTRLRVVMQEVLRFCAAVFVRALWAAAAPFSPAAGDVQWSQYGGGDQDKKKNTGCIESYTIQLQSRHW